MRILLLLFMLQLPAHAARQSGKVVGTGEEAIKIELSDPRGGWTVDQMVLVAGKVSDPTVDPVLVNINGARYLLRTTNGEFRRKFPVTAGKNTVAVIATNKKGTFKQERALFAKVPTTPIMVILTSDTDGVYTDLHIYEPKTGLKDPVQDSKEKTAHVYWASTGSPTGGNFYLNSQEGDFDKPGYGPYLYTHRAPPVGIYRIDANYWPGGDKGHTLATLNVTLNGGQPSELSRAVRMPLAKPGETVTLAWIRVDKGNKYYFYAPGVDQKPRTNEIWPEWVVSYVPKQGASENEE